MAQSDTLRSALCVLFISSAAVLVVFLTACASVHTVILLKGFFAFVAKMVLLGGEIIAATVAAITSGSTVTLSVILASFVSAVTFPPSSIQARVVISAAVSASGIVASACALFLFGSLRVDLEVAAAIVTAAALSVAFASAWAVGVMSLVEKETQQVGLKMTSILDSVRHNHYYILQVLVKLSGSLEQRDLDQGLLYAVKAGFQECALVLLNAGASPNVKDGYQNTPLILACESGSVNLAKLLLDKGAEVDERNGGRGTALHAAAKWGYPPCVELLLKSGSDPNVQDGLWRTPLMLAARHAHEAEAIMSMLIQAGSDVNIIGGESRTVFHYAACRGLDVEPLVVAGADPFLPDTEGNTPLHFAALEGHATVVQTLLRVGSKPNAMNYQKRTPVHAAASKGEIPCLSALIKYNGDLNSPDNANCTPVWQAASNGHSEAVVFCLKYNCYLGAFTRHGKRIMSQNPLGVAIEKRHFQCAKCLAIGGCNTAHLFDWLLEIPMIIQLEEENIELIEWLKSCAQSPWSLMYSCRKVIRQCLGPYIIGSVHMLPVPRKLKEYILLAELDDTVRLANGAARHEALWHVPTLSELH